MRTRSRRGIRPVHERAAEAANNLIKRVKRVAFGFTRFRNCRVRVLLYAGRPNWALLRYGHTPLNIRRASKQG